MAATDNSEHRTGPLSGVRIIDLTHVLNGPFCTMLLAHMGAQVIKIEHDAGDPFRSAWMPIGSNRDGYEFSAVNSNKKGITLNLKHPLGKELFLRLVMDADVVVENFSIGVMDRLGIGYDDLAAIRPDIIYACSRGYGESGPRARVRANAATINASSGWTATSWEYSGRPGTKSLGIGDEAAGVSMALGIVSALYFREKTGVGQKVEISMQEALLGFMVSTFHTLIEGQPVGRDLKQCADGYVAFHTPAITDQLWEQFANAMGHSEAITDPRFATAEARRANFEELESVVLSSWVRSKTRREMQQVFEDTRISAASVMSFSEVLDDEHLRAREAFVDIETPESSTITLLRPWIRFSETPSAIVSAAPAIGADNEEIYSGLLGLSKSDIDSLVENGVI